jgi:hypothetical protein
MNYIRNYALANNVAMGICHYAFLILFFDNAAMGICHYLRFRLS